MHSRHMILKDFQNMQVGYLGRKDVHDDTSSLKPWLVEGLEPAVSIATGRSTGAAVTRSGEIYTWGSAPLGRKGDGFTPGLVQGTEGYKVIKACLGEYHGAAITDAGKLLLWGSTGEGQIQEVNGVKLSETAGLAQGWPEDVYATAIACGFQHTLVIGSTCNATSGAAAGHALDGASSALLELAKATNETVFLGESSDKAADASNTAGQLEGNLFSSKGNGLFTPPPKLIAEPASADSKRGDDADKSTSNRSSADASVGAADLDSSAADFDTQQFMSSPHVTYTFPGIVNETKWSAEECPQGPRPAWLANCSAVKAKDDVPQLDRAWHGILTAANTSDVRGLHTKL